MSGEKPHKATPKREAEFRKRGDIARAPELTAAGTLVGGAIAVAATAPATMGRIAELIKTSAQLDDLAVVSSASIAAFGFALVPVIVGGLIGGLISGCLQLGWPPAFRWPKFDFSKFLSAGPIMESLSPKAAAGRLGKALLRTGILALAVGLVIKSDLAAFLLAPALDPIGLGRSIAGTVGRIALFGGGALIAVAFVDYGLARRKLSGKMKMSTQEVRQEHRESEGDPAVKGARRRRMRELAKRRLTAVKEATVVIVNPTEYAVALRYRSDKDRAPTVVAKGRGAIAARIRELARSAGVPIVRQPPLARLLHKLVPEGKEIPATAYKAVAEILAYVYRLRGRR